MWFILTGAVPWLDLLCKHVGRKEEVSTKQARAVGVKGRPFGGTV